jgi:excisionase family DNA binding protein
VDYSQVELQRFKEAQVSETEIKLDYRSPEWVADALGIDKNTVYKYLQEGSLPALQLGRKWLVSERRLAEFLERAEREQTDRRRRSAKDGSRPFGLPPHLHLLDEEQAPGTEKQETEE